MKQFLNWLMKLNFINLFVKWIWHQIKSTTIKLNQSTQGVDDDEDQITGKSLWIWLHVSFIIILLKQHHVDEDHHHQQSLLLFIINNKYNLIINYYHGVLYFFMLTL